MTARRLTNYKVTVVTSTHTIIEEKDDAGTAVLFGLMAASNDFDLPVADLVEGETVSGDIKVTVECLMNRLVPRAPRRPPDVIAAEKKAKADAKAARHAAYEVQWEERQTAKEREVLLCRTRITHQIDYAFKSGPESGSEPVAKFITCHVCDALADYLLLNREVPSGATVLDESTIVGAVCSEHNESNYWGEAQMFPCSQLEFFYSGIRQIAIKAVAA